MNESTFYQIFLWIILIIIIIIVIAVIIISHIKCMALFQATRDEKWYPTPRDPTDRESPNDKLINDFYSSKFNKPYKRDYTDKFTDGYLIIGDSEFKLRTKQEIIHIQNSRTFNIGDLHYINIWKFENFPGNRVVLYFHGNNDNISYRKYVADICYALKLNLVLVDYRGYGDSGNYPTSEFLLEDSDTAYKHVANEYSSDRIIIWGESLGGIAAIWAASRHRCNYLVLLSTFADLKTAINNLEIPSPVKKALIMMMKSKSIENGKWIKSVRSPIVIIHSPDDDLLPYVNAEMLYVNARVEQKKIINIRGPHAHPYLSKENLIELLEFIHLDPQIISDDNTIKEVVEIINNI